ncbi:hypothetical protein C8A03DRAFT_15970 [Achaetomium macrosporum]|uniref:DUF7357 domain-containing protein n=1 Tax=Achaetomium macrosporum TaxID=79813 RepID=A0AAN7HA88_9PEZI|nr:hypothetical protein C8A03DRAFT_15970 [Achaetomium macrosporum]
MGDSSSLRLRLVVRRHELPEARVIFAVQLDNDPTIANLLEQVNDIIPLESNDWGLEDYTVQLRDSKGRGFDCLHFQQVSAILRNDEEVFIRPLDTGDRRKRRLSGRDQISADGRHLIDGVAFGRPRLKTPRDRPPVDIPPLKRRRIAYEAEEDEDQEPQLLLTQHGEDNGTSRRVRIRTSLDDAQDDGSEGDDEDGDEEFVDDDRDRASDTSDETSDTDHPGQVDIDDEELQDLLADNEQTENEGPVEQDSSDKSAKPSVQQGPSKDKIQALRAAFPTASFKACGAALSRRRRDIKLAYRSLQRQHQPAMSLSAMLAHPDRQPSKAVPTEDSEADLSGAESVASVAKHFDQHGFPSGSILAGTAAAQVAEAMRKAGHAVKAPVHTRFDEDSATVQADQVPLPMSDSESSGSDNESDSDGGPEVASSKIPEPSGGAKLSGSDRSSVSGDSDSQSDSSGDSESESDSGDENDSESDSDSDSDSNDGSDHDDSDSDAGSVRDHADASDDDSDDGDISDGSDADLSTGKDSDQVVADSSASGSESDGGDSSSDDDSSDDSSDDSVDEASRPHPVEKEAIATVPPSLAQNQTVQEPASEEVASHAKSNSTETPKPVPPGQGKPATQRRNARRRAALRARKAAARGECLQAPGQPSQSPLDVEARGLLESVAAKKAALLERFNVLAEASIQQLRNPENKQDAQGLPDHTGNQDEESKDGGVAREDPQAWRDKIIYRAVECCHDDIELSEPPFPFVQGWDPQQQDLRGRWKRKQRNQPEYVEGRSAAKRRKYAGNGESFYSYDGDTGVGDTPLNYDDEPEESAYQAEQAADQAVGEDNDLPPIPADVSALPSLTPGKAQPGMILTWKQWLLSKATNWQPQVSSLTGIVVDVLDDSTLKLRLARRDRNLDRNEKIYDDEGNRVYDKFELPGMGDEGESEDEAAEQGYRTLKLADMIETRILQQPASRPVEGESPERQPSRSSEGHAMNDAKPDAGLNASDSKAHAIPGQIEAESESKAIDSPHADVDAQHGDPSIASETPGAQEPGDMSISEDRRHEISQIINDAGFRKDVDPSVIDNGALDLSSPSRQLEEETILDAAAFSEVSQAQSHASRKPNSQATSNNIDSQPIFLEPFRGFSDPISEPHVEGRVAYPKLELPPSESGSLHSGRQVDPDFSIELGNDSLHGIDDAAGESRSTLGRRSSDEQYPTSKMPPEHDSSSESESDSSDSSIPSLSEYLPSTSTNRSHSPSKRDIESAIKARKSEVAPDPEYEAEMRRLDDANDVSEDEDDKSQQQPHFSQLAQELVEKSIEKPTPKKQRAQRHQKPEVPKPSTAPRIKTEPASPPARIKAERATTSSRNSPFVVPEGSQVVSLLSSSPEPELEEHYAEDSIDETYAEPSSSLPDGSGWVQKRKKKREREKKEARPHRGLGVGLSTPSSAPAEVSAPKRTASSHERLVSAHERLASARERLVSASEELASSLSTTRDGSRHGKSGSGSSSGAALNSALQIARRKVFANIL